VSVQADPGGARAQDVRAVTANISVGARLLASAAAFVFVSFLFAFFYLRSVNSNGLWRPAHVKPLPGYGIVVLICTLAAAVIFDVARRKLVGGTEPGWRVPSLLALGLGLGVVIVQLLDYHAIHFHTAGGGYASVFWGWTLMFLLFWVGALYWMETLVAQSLRRPPASPRLGTAGSELLAPSAAACVVYLYTLAAIQLVSYVLLYLVK
jgi:heme/copper-type cytochrome/quinol oxidase subunit 3